MEIEKIIGKTIVFTDLHLGLKAGSKTRLAICVQVIKDILKCIKSENIQNVIFCGDWHHTRNSIESNVLNVSYKLMQALAKVANVYCILGNHDLYLKNSTDVNSLVIFRDIPHVKVYDCVTPVFINSKAALFVPWLGDVSSIEKSSYDMMFGHFEISSQWLMKQYVKSNMTQFAVGQKVQEEIDNDSMLSSSSIQTTKADASDIGDFVEVVKEDGVIFSGHIHSHREMVARRRKFIFVGSPYQQNLGEKDNHCGFYVIETDGRYSFHEISSTPKHVQLKLSQIVKDISAFDFSIVKGNIIHKVYDVEVSHVDDAKISRKIAQWQPYEELLPDYEVSLSMLGDDASQNESISLIKKSKLDYIKNYISSIDDALLSEQKIDRDKLYSVLESYYKEVVEEK